MVQDGASAVVATTRALSEEEISASWVTAAEVRVLPLALLQVHGMLCMDVCRSCLLRMAAWLASHRVLRAASLPSFPFLV